jgi:hypothetical protein
MPLLMKSDLKPLCPKHRTTMRIGVADVQQWLGHRVLCTQSNCSYFYNLIHGYCVHPVGGYGEDDMEWRRLCKIDGRPMYLAGTDERGQHVRRCARADCTAA